MRRWSAGVVACAVAVPLLLGGCAEKHQASESLPPTSKATASATLPPLGPADFPVPAEARKKSPEGVEAFTRYYLALINRTSSIMDATDLRSLSDGCETCDRIATDTEKDLSAGYHYQGGDITITSVAPATTDGIVGDIAFLASQAPMAVVDSGGSPVPGLTFKAFDKLSSAAAVRWDPSRDSWIMTQLTLG